MACGPLLLSKFWVDMMYIVNENDLEKQIYIPTYFQLKQIYLRRKKKKKEEGERRQKEGREKRKKKKFHFSTLKAKSQNKVGKSWLLIYIFTKAMSKNFKEIKQLSFVECRIRKV